MATAAALGNAGGGGLSAMVSKEEGAWSGSTSCERSGHRGRWMRWHRRGACNMHALDMLSARTVGVVGMGVPKPVYVRPKVGPLHRPKANGPDVAQDKALARGQAREEEEHQDPQGPPQDPSGAADIPRQGPASRVKRDAREGHASSRHQSRAVSPLVQRGRGRT